MKTYKMILPLLFLLITGCPKRQINMLLPKIKSLYSTDCVVESVETPQGLEYKVKFVAWHKPKIKEDAKEGEERHNEPDWKHWYSQRRDYQKAVSECGKFYKLINHKRKEFYKEQRGDD